MLLTLLIWAYANGVTSSRRIERLCGQDVAFRVICAENLPDHVTIARFGQQFAGTAAGLFAEVLVLCAAGHGTRPARWRWTARRSHAQGR
jgi:transposase